MSAMRSAVSRVETQGSGSRMPLPTLVPMSSTLLTKRRAVDHCRVRSSLCRMR